MDEADRHYRIMCKHNRLFLSPSLYYLWIESISVVKTLELYPLCVKIDKMTNIIFGCYFSAHVIQFAGYMSIITLVFQTCDGL